MQHNENIVIAGIGQLDPLAENPSRRSLRDSLLKMPKSPIEVKVICRSFWRQCRTFIEMLIMPFVVLVLAVMSANNDFSTGLTVLVLLYYCLFLPLIFIAKMVQRRAKTPIRSIAAGNYLARWHISPDQQGRILAQRRRNTLKALALVTSVCFLTGLGIGLAIQLDETNSQASGFPVSLRFAGGNALCGLFMWWYFIGRKGVREEAKRRLTSQVIVGLDGAWVAGEFVEFEHFHRISQSAGTPDEFQIELRFGRDGEMDIPLPFPSEERQTAEAVMAILNSPARLLLQRATDETTAPIQPAMLTQSQTEYGRATYSYKLSAMNKVVTLRLNERTVDIFDHQQRLKRQIDYGQIKTFHEYDGVPATDPGTGPYRSELCDLKFKYGKPLKLRNGSYMSPRGKVGELSTNQQADYAVFTDELKRRVLKSNQTAGIEYGSASVMVVWGVVMMFGLAIMSGPFFEYFYFKQPLRDCLGPLGVACFIGLPAFLTGLSGTKCYEPRRQSLTNYFASKHAEARK